MSSASAITTRTFPKQAGSLKKGDFALLKGAPCKISEITTSKTGKHGHAKANITGYDIFNGKKYEDVCPTSHNIECPEVVRKDYQLMDIQGDGFLVLLDQETNEEKSDLKLPADEVGQKIKEMFDQGLDLIVTVQQAVGIEQAVDVKEEK
jgi:translation initiation factor 5A